MCMEDVRLGRRTRVTSRSLVIGAAVTQIALASSDRIALIISSPLPVNLFATHPRITLSMLQTVTDQDGLIIYGGNPPFKISIQEYGAFVTQSLYAIADAASRRLGIIEVFLAEK